MEGPPAPPAALFFCALLVLCGCSEPARSPSRATEPAPAAAATPADPGQGKWRQARGAAETVRAEDVKSLRATPYLQGYRPAEDRPLVVEHAPGKVAPGLNLYLSGHAAEAVLMDRKGAVLHRWRHPLRRLWPDLAADPGMAKLEYWRRAWLFPNGDLLGVYEGLGLVKLDSRSNVLWARRGGFHHDLQVRENGEIWVLDREGRIVPRINPREGILEDFVTVLDPAGRVLRRFSLLEAFERSAHASMLAGMERAGDVFHSNTLEVLDGRFAAKHPAFREGNVLVSVLKLDALAILDPDRREIVWARKGAWRRQHQPTFLDNGNLLVFDNRGPGIERSRVIEVEPLTGEVLWGFGGTPEVDFFSKTLGSCQRLPNGNTLITESENGRALEVDPAGEVVWEFNNPHRAGERNELVAVLFEVVRLPPEFLFKGHG